MKYPDVYYVADGIPDACTWCELSKGACEATWATQLYGCCGACEHRVPGSLEKR